MANSADPDQFAKAVQIHLQFAKAGYIPVQHDKG